MNVNKFTWLYNRLKAMSAAEILWRVSQKVTALKEFQKYKHKRYITEANLIKKHDELAFIKNLDLNRFYICYDSAFKQNFSVFYQKEWRRTIEIADAICNKRINIVGDRIQQFETNINWFTGINTDQNWPLVFSANLDFRQSDHIGDVRFVWDLNRHYHFFLLAKSYYLTNEEQYIQEFKLQFYDWVDKNPFLYGINWTSSMEIAIRAYSWLWSVIVIYTTDYAKNRELIEDLFNAIINSIEYVSKHFSLYSSANNHLIVEAAITGMIGIVVNNQYWLKTSIKILKRELELQVFEDGVNKEQALHYQSFVMEVVGLYILLLRKNNIQYPAVFDERLQKMSEFISDLTNETNNVPDIGDSDEGCILNIIGRSYNHYEYVLQLTSYIFNKRFLIVNEINENLIWIFNKQSLTTSFNGVYDNSNSKIYSKGGYSILKYKDEVKERVLTFDHAELGYGSIAAHGHADLLSITLSIDGRKVLIDPGTYIYNIERSWRDYFRKTINHNTIEINGKDQAPIRGTFLWGEKPVIKLERYQFTAEFDIVCASYMGAHRVRHERTVIFLKPDLFIIKDQLDGEPQKWCLTYMIDSGIDLKLKDGGNVQLQLNGSVINMLFRGDGNIAITQEYQSAKFGKKCGTKAIRAVGRPGNDKTLMTFIAVGREVPLVKNRNEFCYNNVLYSIKDNAFVKGVKNNVG